MPSVVSRGPSRVVRLAVAGSLAVVTVFALAGCVEQPAPEPTSSPTASSATTATPSATPEPPHFIAGGSAEQNQPYFDLLISESVAANPAAKGRDLIDTLVAGGFDKAAMEVTPDTTSVRLDADSIQFSVRLGTGCILGDWGHGAFSSTVVPVLPTGKCLVGQTRPIDW